MFVVTKISTNKILTDKVYLSYYKNKDIFKKIIIKKNQYQKNIDTQPPFQIYPLMF